jgi:hypothetical protein
MKQLYFFILILCSSGAFAQLHDYTWVLGYAGGEDSPDQDSFGLSILFFQNERISIIDNQYGVASLKSNNISFSNEEGTLILYYDGKNIYGENHDPIVNGNDWFEGGLSGGWRQAQSGLMFNNPHDTTLFHLINVENNYFPIPPNSADVVGEDLFYSEIRKINEEQGEVILRKHLILNDTLGSGKLSACKHANGRDWWIIVPEWNSNRYYRYLLTPQGIDTMGVHEVEEPIMNGLGQALFSPDGSKHVRYNAISFDAGEWISVYDFDRCTGLLSNVQQINLPVGGPSGGAAISKNSRYLYTTSNIYIYQYDLQAADVLATRTLVAEYDGFLDPFPTNFYQAQLAPDGKIYICAANGVLSMHVIHHPDQYCPDCFIDQHSIALPTYNSFSIPNLPNYRLGPIDGSPCDTLGIDNLPLARWRYMQDTLEPLEVFFTDLSDYEPTAWFWDFGDGFTSTEQNPTHLFGEVGTYEVCLTVSNENSSDTQCKTLTFEIVDTHTETPTYTPIARVFPNPFQRYLSFSLRKDWLPVDTRVVVFDAVGRMVQNRQLATGMNTLDMGEASAGIYFYQIINEGDILQQGKVVKR